MRKEIDISGKKFNKLTAIRYCWNKNGTPYWLFKCDCGKTTIARKSLVVSGKTKSCGCLWNEKVKGKGFHKTHLLTHTRIYKIYVNIKDRCYNDKNKRYNRYGGRGITVCDEWLNKKSGVENFYKWEIKNGYNDNLTIDRIDVNGNYCPENCRWADNKEQQRNKGTNIFITHNGEKRCLSEWSEITGICYSTIINRARRGWGAERILTEKIHNNGVKNGKRTATTISC